MIETFKSERTPAILLHGLLYGGLLILLGGVLNACAMDKASWQEEVLLHDGSKIIVERSQTRGGAHEIGQEVPVYKHTLSFLLPRANRRVVWESTYGVEIEELNLLPLALEVVRDEAYIVTTPTGCLAYNKWKRPNPPYVVQKFDGKVWRPIPLAQLPKEIKEANLVIGALTRKFERRLTGRSVPVPGDEIKRINAEAKDPNVLYVRVFAREPLKAGSPGVSCPDYSSPRYTSPKAPD